MTNAKLINMSVIYTLLLAMTFPFIFDQPLWACLGSSVLGGASYYYFMRRYYGLN